MYILDTDTLIYFMKGFSNIVMRISGTEKKYLYTTVINQAELLHGAYNSEKKQQNLTKVSGLLFNLHILEFTSQSADLFAKEKTLLKKSGTIIADLDLMIASICIEHNMVLVSNNHKHFQRLKNLKLENWNID